MTTESRSSDFDRPLSVIKRISWAAVLGGVVVALAVQLLLSLLGLAIGASTVDPLQEQNPLSGLGTGTGVWFGVSMVISLFAGGWVAGRLAGMNRRLESGLHGVLTWAFTALIAFYFINSLLSSAVNSMAGVVKTSANVVGQSVASVAPQIGNLAQQQLQQRGIDISSIRQEAATILRQTGKPALQPDAIQNQAEASATDAGQTAQTAAQNPAGNDAELTALVDRVFSRGEATLNQVDREAVVNVLVARGMTPDQAGQTVDRWQSAAVVARQQYDQAMAAAEQKAREVGDKAAENISKGALVSFIALVLGAIAAAIGGITGMPRSDLGVTTLRRDSVGIPRPVH